MRILIFFKGFCVTLEWKSPPGFWLVSFFVFVVLAFVYLFIFHDRSISKHRLSGLQKYNQPPAPGAKLDQHDIQINNFVSQSTSSLMDPILICNSRPSLSILLAGDAPTVIDACGLCLWQNLPASNRFQQNLACNIILRRNSTVKLAKIYTPLRPVNAREVPWRGWKVSSCWGNEVSVAVNSLFNSVSRCVRWIKVMTYVLTV